jgi:hypothetical protein
MRSRASSAHDRFTSETIDAIFAITMRLFAVAKLFDALHKGTAFQASSPKNFSGPALRSWPFLSFAL